MSDKDKMRELLVLETGRSNGIPAFVALILFSLLSLISQLMGFFEPHWSLYVLGFISIPALVFEIKESRKNKARTRELWKELKLDE